MLQEQHNREQPKLPLPFNVSCAYELSLPIMGRLTTTEPAERDSSLHI